MSWPKGFQIGDYAVAKADGCLGQIKSVFNGGEDTGDFYWVFAPLDGSTIRPCKRWWITKVSALEALALQGD